MTVSNSNLYTQAYVNTGDGQPVILLNGLFGNVHIWKPLVEALRNNFQVIIPRIPLTNFALDDTNVKQVAQYLHEFITHHQLQNVILVGHAVGGQLALMYTHLYPANIRKLVLVSSGGLMERTSSEVDTTHYIQSLLEEPEQRFYLKEFANETATEEITQTSKQFRVSTFLNKIDHPVLLVWGLQDPISPPESALHFNDLLGNSEIKFIEDCGHVPMLEKPEEFTQHVLTFLKLPKR